MEYDPTEMYRVDPGETELTDEFQAEMALERQAKQNKLLKPIPHFQVKLPLRGNNLLQLNNLRNLRVAKKNNSSPGKKVTILVMLHVKLQKLPWLPQLVCWTLV